MTLAPRWIPVEECLPEPEVPVLATDGEGTFIAMLEGQVGIWILLLGYVPASGVDVTHWRPMPDPPRTIN